MKWHEPIGARIVPANFGPMKGFNAHARIEGSCGDSMEFWLEVEAGSIRRATFTTDGCDTSMACGSVVAHVGEGKGPEALRTLRPMDILELLGAPDDEEAHHCADLALRTVLQALEQPVFTGGSAR
jgi:nitrogen fixation protein NifU and related proteins